MDGAHPPPCRGLAPPPAPTQKVTDKGKRDEWNEDGVLSLLEVYESKWVLRNRAKLKGSDWEDIAHQVSVRCSGAKAFKTPTQCKNKIEAMKKRYRAESASSGSSWQFYSRMDDLLKGASNCVAHPKIDHHIDLQALPKVEMEVVADGHLHDSNHDDGSNTLPIEVDAIVENNNDKKENRGTDSHLSASRSKKAATEDAMDPGNSSKRRKLLGSEVAESIRLLAQSMLQIERARLEMYKDTERMRAEAEIKRGEMELKKTEIIANTQLQIAKLFMKGMHRSSKTENPSPRTELNMLPKMNRQED
ncbi:hypothetical protein Cni_G01354 [Canna indica]|uniref:Myb/SANT-like DNA-binding domain-containing protein n=1 Tax=Canna indica TaxID=4628 RepID=A0AAQ3PYJ4_9LILI|nr:hypothetical protein Cni_G01354 [Canna indica]